MTFNYNSLTDCDGSKVVQLCFSASYSMQNKVYFFDMLSFKIYRSTLYFGCHHCHVEVLKYLGRDKKGTKTNNKCNILQERNPTECATLMNQFFQRDQEPPSVRK